MRPYLVTGRLLVGLAVIALLAGCSAGTTPSTSPSSQPSAKVVGSTPPASADPSTTATASATVVCGTPTTVPDTAPPGGPSRFEPPDGYAYFGFMYRLWESDDPAQGDTRDFAARICDAVDVELAGKTPSTLFVWSSWQESDGSAQPFSAVLPDIQKIHQALGPGVVPLLEWAANSATDPSITPYPGITTKDVASGSLDDYIREYAREVKQYGAPLFIRLICGEFNGNWNAWCSPKANPSITRADFIDAWRRVVDIFREERVENVAWLWNPVTPAPWAEESGWDTDWEGYYPGDAYVDWVGADLNDWGEPDWLDPVYAFAVAHQKPLFLAEFAIRDRKEATHADHLAWLEAMFGYVETHPAVKAVSYANYKSFPDATYDVAATHTYLYDGQVNYATDANDLDCRLLAGGADIRALYADRVGHDRYVSTVVTGP